MLNPVSINASGSYYGELQRAKNGAGEHLEASGKKVVENDGDDGPQLQFSLTVSFTLH